MNDYKAYRDYMIKQGFVPLTEAEWEKMNEHFDKADAIANKILDEIGA